MSDLPAIALPWASLALLGAVHRVNPGMGWLFAVALGLQERKRATVLSALGPIACVHAISVGMVALAVPMLHLWTEVSVLKRVAALALIGFGAHRLLAQNTHHRWIGMRVTGRNLTVWSFLMATAHGAGLMLVLILLRLPDGSATSLTQPASAAALTHAGHTSGFGHAELAVSFGTLRLWVGDFGVPGELIGVLIHSAAMLLVMALVALLVFNKLGLAILRHAWVNIHRLWAGNLVGVGAFTILV